MSKPTDQVSAGTLITIIAVLIALFLMATPFPSLGILLLAILQTSRLVWTLVTGQTRARGQLIQRAVEPAGYWFMIVFYVLLSGMLWSFFLWLYFHQPRK